MDGGTWDDLPAAHAAAVAFDLGCAGLLWLLGRRLRDGALGLLLAYLWLAFPFTLLVANSGANDALVAAARARRAARGGTAGGARRAGRARGPDEVRAAGARAAVRRLPAAPAATRTAVAFAAVVAVALAPFDLSVLWDRTLGFQRERDSPFSIWGLYELPDGLQLAAQPLAAAFAVAVAFLRPARRSPRWPPWPPRC